MFKTLLMLYFTTTVADLGHDAFTVREAASAKLWRSGYAAQLVIPDFIAKSDDIEIINRLRRAQTSYRSLPTWEYKSIIVFAENYPDTQYWEIANTPDGKSPGIQFIHDYYERVKVKYDFDWWQYDTDFHASLATEMFINDLYDMGIPRSGVHLILMYMNQLGEQKESGGKAHD